MTREATARCIAEIVRLQLGKPRVRPDDRLVDDLGAASMDLMNIAVAIEDRFGCHLDDTTLARCHTVADLYAAVAESQKASE